MSRDSAPRFFQSDFYAITTRLAVDAGRFLLPCARARPCRQDCGGEGDERVAALNEAVAKGEPQLAEFLHALQDGRVRVKDGKALIDAPEGDEPIVNNRMRREIDAALAGSTGVA